MSDAHLHKATGPLTKETADRLPGLNEVSVLSVVEHLYRLLVIKYSAYFGSASPIFPKKGQPPTADLLQGDGRLSREWENVLLRRKEFCEHSNFKCLGAPYHTVQSIAAPTRG